MLKFVGSFDKLKEKYDLMTSDNGRLTKLIVANDYWLFIEFDIETRELLPTKVLKCSFSVKDTYLTEYTNFIYDLIKDGLVIKEVK